MAAFAEACCAMRLLQVTRQTIPEGIQEDFSRVIGLAPALLGELLTILLRQRPPFGAFADDSRHMATAELVGAGYFWLRPVLSTLEYSQGLTQALPLGCVRFSRLNVRAAPLTLCPLQHPPRQVEYE